MYRNDNRIILDKSGSVEDAQNKIKTLVKDLHLTICKINRINKETGHQIDDLEKIRKTVINEYEAEEAIFPRTRKKLLKATKDARSLTQDEVSSLRDALDIIQNIRQLREEKRVLQNEVRSTRRGVLMSQLQTLARTAPLWIGGPDESPPPLCGSIAPKKDHKVMPGDKVATKSGEDWILAEVISNNGATLLVEDIDAVDATKSKMTISRNLIIPLPQWRANPQNCAQALHEVGAHVLALYPQTTCFYKGIIASIPETSSEDYVVLFEDNAYPSGFSPPMSVPQKYIVQFPLPKSIEKIKREKITSKPASKLTASTSSKGKNKKKRN